MYQPIFEITPEIEQHFDSPLRVKAEATVEVIALSKSISTATQLALGKKQDLLVSGVNIKTINNQSILGSGNLTIAGSGGGVYPYTSLQFTIQPLL